MSPCLIVQYRVALEATISRPSTSRLPSVSSFSALASCEDAVAASSPGAAGLPSWPSAWPRAAPPAGRRGGGRPEGGRSVGWLRPPRRQPAQRAGRPARADDLHRALGEGPGHGRGDAHPQHPGAVFGHVLGERLDRRLGLLLRLDDHPLLVPVPGQGDCADPEVLEQRHFERAVVGRCHGLRRVAAAAPQHLVQQLVEALGEQADLNLLQRHAGHPAGRTGLQVKRPLARLAHRPGDEPLWRIV